MLVVFRKLRQKIFQFRGTRIGGLLHIVCFIFGILIGFGYRIIHRSGGDTLRKRLAGTSAEQAGIQQGVAAKTVRAVHGYTRAFAGCEQAANDGAFAVNPTVHFAVGGDRNAAHGVVCGRFDRHIILGRVKIGVLFDCFHHLGQHFMHMVGINAGHIEPHAILRAIWILRIRHATSGVDFSGDGAADHVSRGQIGVPGSILFHEGLTIGITEHATFRAGRFRQQNAGMCQTGRVKLHEFAVFQLQSGM